MRFRIILGWSRGWLLITKLNAASPDVDYGFIEVEIIALVQDAFASGDAETAKDMLAAENELGCPLD